MKILTRQEFNQICRARDKNECAYCKGKLRILLVDSTHLSVHHIFNRHLYEGESGYLENNGITLCSHCHKQAERTLITPEQLAEAAGITLIRPPHFEDGVKYDTFGNPYLNKNTRARGEFFYDENVQRALKAGKVLDDFVSWTKYPKTMHLPWSPGLQNDDRLIKDFSGLENEEVVVTIKFDGENTAMYRDDIHARSLDGRSHPSRNWVKALHGTIKHEIPENFRINGENCYAKHSLYYPNLPTYFFVFNMWEKSRRLSWDDMCGYADMLGLTTVPVLWRGMWDESKIRELTESLDPVKYEGAVIQVTREIRASEWKKTAAKYVRKGHVQTNSNWMQEIIIPNCLADYVEDSSFEAATYIQS